ncbi:unnamed protein product [Penicillium roqueforti FM164]|uniref:Genomic scaffold, ProqFM164S02 n=1 Tax=Penicillium roqueforti (strain FM164) TaxID=1365484 RepID=W6Q3P7_PENRF|nr:unnamed protein product [Penicillium roqueforti FM164]
MLDTGKKGPVPCWMISSSHHCRTFPVSTSHSTTAPVMSLLSILSPSTGSRLM